MRVNYLTFVYRKAKRAQINQILTDLDQVKAGC